MQSFCERVLEGGMLDPASWWEEGRRSAIAESYIAAWAVDPRKVVSLSSLTIKISLVSSLLEPIFFVS
jgi:hypothetical protein